MRVTCPVTYFALTQLVLIQTWTSPITALPNGRRSAAVCANDPTVVAGSTNPPRPPRSVPIPSISNPANLHPRNPAPDALTPRSTLPLYQPTTWCHPASRTFILVTLTRLANGDGVPFLLQDAAGILQDGIARWGPDLPLSGLFSWAVAASGLSIKIWQVPNARRRLLTWGMANVALAELYGFMSAREFGSATFGIWDGGDEVGKGVIWRND